MKIIKCPYKSSSSFCTHKAVHGKRDSNNRLRRSKCIFKNQIKCPIFNEWCDLLAEQEKLLQNASKRPQTTSQIQPQLNNLHGKQNQSKAKKMPSFFHTFSHNDYQCFSVLGMSGVLGL